MDRSPAIAEVNEIEEAYAKRPHKTSEVICIACGSRWVSVRPTTVYLKQIECPFCKAVGRVIETGETLLH